MIVIKYDKVRDLRAVRFQSNPITTLSLLLAKSVVVTVPECARMCQNGSRIAKKLGNSMFCMRLLSRVSNLQSETMKLADKYKSGINAE